MSTMRAVTCSIPKGTVLWPVMFTTFTNDMSEATKANLCPNHQITDDILFGNDCTTCGVTPAYADDVTHVVRSRQRNENQQKLCNNLQSIANYLELNQLLVNQGKTQLLESMHTAGSCPVPSILYQYFECLGIYIQNSIQPTYLKFYN